ncbi:MAG: HAD family hydrolase [Steroidobacteraceae bacterium]
MPPGAPDLEVILFDVGGVLLEVHGIAVILDWLEHRVTAEEVWRMWFGSPSARAFESGRIGADEFAAGILAELRLEMPPRTFLESFVTWPARLYPGAAELVARIPARYRRAVLSNTNALHWPRVIGELGLGASFEQCFVSHLMGKIKPDAQAFEHAIEALACDPGRILFLDDNLINVEAARSCGLRAVQVRGIAATRRTLEALRVLESES